MPGPRLRLRRQTVALLAVIGSLLIAGCGGGHTVGAHALSTQAASLQSLAAEGGLLAQDAASGRTTHVFIREHASELQRTASQVAASLAAARTEPGLEPRRRRLSTLATRISADLDRLGAASSAGQRSLGRRLSSAARQSGDIAESLG